jgi:(2Fe-2S) ferredoxin
VGGHRHGEPDCLLVCAGKDCRGSSGFEALMDAAEHLPHAYATPCQGLCHGPIAGVRVDGRVHWYERVRTGKVRKQLIASVSEGRRRKALRVHEVRSRRDVVKHGKRARALGRRSSHDAFA